MKPPNTAWASWPMTVSCVLLDVRLADRLPFSASCSAGSSAILMSVARASAMIEASMVIESSPISSRVVAAFLLFGFWNAGTPLLIASTPVRAAQPEENARSSRNAVAMPAIAS